MKRPPLGTSDFKKIIEENYAYADKTLFIQEIMTNSAEEALIPRPRRFEKTTNFDDFSEKTHLNYSEAFEEAIQNRELLQEVMKKHGFIGLATEWWHFDFIGWKNPPIDF